VTLDARATGADGIAIRSAVAADADHIAALYLASFGATYTFALSHSDDEVRAWVRDVLVPAGHAIVAVDAGAIAGFAVVEPGDLDQLYVAPDRLGEGIGRRLLDAAKARSPDGLALYTFQVNDRARRFYERNGFVADQFGDGTGNEEGQPDVHYVWRPV
jgi:GNAT superfamily N-acetyltransferase